MSLKAVFFDMDGTLLNAQNKLSALTVKVLEQLRKKGVFCVISTGRPYLSALAVMDEANFCPDYFIVNNGATIMDPKADAVILQRKIDQDIVRQILSFSFPTASAAAKVPGKREFMTNCYCGNKWYTDVYVPEIAGLLCTPSFKPEVVDLTVPKPEEGETTSIWFGSFEPSVMDMVEADLLKVLDLSRVEVQKHQSFIVDVCARNATKGSAVATLCETVLGVPLEQTAGFGDMMNDYSMLKVVGKPFIMKNGQEVLKKALPHATIIGHHNEDGVAKCLIDLFKLSD